MAPFGYETQDAGGFIVKATKLGILGLISRQRIMIVLHPGEGLFVPLPR
jgi:hypothetical protein